MVIMWRDEEIYVVGRVVVIVVFGGATGGHGGVVGGC